MMDFCLAIGLFTMTVVVHILFCRQQKTKGLQAKAFIFIALFFLLIYIVITVLFNQRSFEWSSGLLFVLLVPVYLCFYVLTQLTSPSKKILQALDLQGPLNDKQIVAAIEEEDFINTRLHDLLISGCVVAHQDAYALTASGDKIAWILKAMQVTTGRGMGG